MRAMVERPMRGGQEPAVARSYEFELLLRESDIPIERFVC